MTYKISAGFIILFLFSSCSRTEIPIREGKSDLAFTHLAESWDEAIPLGNGMLGALVWGRDSVLRLSLDRADLWDLRPVQEFSKPEWRFSWVCRQWEKKDYASVQKYFDEPYDRDPAPTKIPAGALEFRLSSQGNPSSVRLSLADASCLVQWGKGVRFISFIHATDPVGWFRFENLPADVLPEIVPPAYTREKGSGTESPVTGQDLQRLGYPGGSLKKHNNCIVFNQKGWGGFEYQITVRWKKRGTSLEGCWSISSKFPGGEASVTSERESQMALSEGFNKAFRSHKNWWNTYWAQSQISIPDSILQKQWELETYKFGSAARKGAPPISLQAVWTADNGKLPPWKGDFHHDLNTQLSYWPAYSGNHLELEEGFLDWLWDKRETFEKYTRTYYESDGLNVPGVTTLTGEPMGGWIQYSFGPTVSAWLGQHFYLHWRYSMDRTFLEERAYPWIAQVANFLEDISIRDANGKRKLRLSSSPEYFDNAREAWFSETTNFDLALIRFTYQKAAELALELGKKEEAARWDSLLGQWPGYAVDPSGGLMVAPAFPFSESHRHFSHLMAIHPLGTLDWSGGEADQKIIRNSMQSLSQQGTAWWTGYSFSWLGNLKARAFDGNGAAEALRIFAQCFCLPNSFHANGDQCQKGYSNFNYMPFTLEGNFAFAAAIQEMLIQSHSGVILLFPALPDDWKNVSFNRLRTQGAFLVSAEKVNGEVVSVRIFSEKGGLLKLKNPFEGKKFLMNDTMVQENRILERSFREGEELLLKGLATMPAR